MAYDILIVDDSATTRALIRRAIQFGGVPTAGLFEAPNGRAALDVLATQHVDVILTDLHMPEMDGVELTRRVLADDATRHIPVVVISAEPDPARIAELQAQGVRGHLRKPFRPEGVRDVITNLFGGTHA
jgi:two-component system chemotaxis response regulator CheY